MSALPYKLNQDRRHHIPRQRRKVVNWPAYEAGLRQRGSLAVWFTDEAVAAWASEPRTTRGGQPFYSPLAILTALTLRAVFRLAYRQTEGLIGSIISLLGLKLCGAGEWLVEKHGTGTRRSWRKLHLGVDADTGQIVAAALTSKELDDAVQVGPLLDQVTGAVSSVTADGADDQDGVYADVAERHPDAAVIVPPRCTAVLSGKAATAPTQRDRHLQCITETGRMSWQKASSYNKRAKVEAAVARWKQVIGDGLRSRRDERRATEVDVAGHVLNRMLELGRPSYVRTV